MQKGTAIEGNYLQPIWLRSRGRTRVDNGRLRSGEIRDPLTVWPEVASSAESTVRHYVCRRKHELGQTGLDELGLSEVPVAHKSQEA